MKDWLVGIWKSKTMWFAAILSVCGVIQANSGVITTLLGPHASSIILLATGVIVAVLRAVTTQSIPAKAQL